MSRAASDREAMRRSVEDAVFANPARSMKEKRTIEAEKRRPP
jgi:hypothetical protein